MKLELIKLPNPKLRQISEEIKTINDDVENLVNNMIQVALDWEKEKNFETTVGLAAVQVNHLKRIILVRQSDSNQKDPFQVLINPKITKLTGGKSESFEGCLSVDRFYSKVERYNVVRIEATDLDGHLIKIKAEGFSAKVFQHEIDHLNGVLTVDRVEDKKGGFCFLDDSGKLQPIDYSKVLKTGILKK